MSSRLSTSELPEPDEIDDLIRVIHEVTLTGATRRLLWLSDRGDNCISHLSFFLDVPPNFPVRPGYVHDMVTAEGFQKRGLLRRLIAAAQEHLPKNQRLYCEDRGLTVDGGPVAVHLGLISADEYRDDWPERQTYEKLRGSDHLGHPKGPGSSIIALPSPRPDQTPAADTL
ncbi:hypothetical protein [Micromonospora sp. DT227]|uniref:hypothetical protein n=1 Tax=Micromonospora sp. DT227 TaxID=3393433 RepID=UPI003CEB652D